MANNNIKAKPVKITETVLRDAHQSLIATRMPTEEMLAHSIGKRVSRWRLSAAASASISLSCVSGPKLTRSTPDWTFFGRFIAS